MDIPLLSKEDVTIKGMKKERKKEKGKEKGERPKEEDNTGTRFVRDKFRKSEKPVRILRVRYYERFYLPFAKDGGVEKVDSFAVNRCLGDLLRELGYDINISGVLVSYDHILVRKDDFGKMGIGDKYLFIDIGTNDFGTLKRQMENHTTICAYNAGEFMILDGKRSSLKETFNIPNNLRMKREKDRKDADNKLVSREKLREELKGEFKKYHTYDDEKIDHMKESELIWLKKLAKRNKDRDDTNRKFYEDLLR